MKVGDYVRTKDGYISKIKELGINVYTDIGCWSEDYIIKSSPNIIDLVEVGDILKFKDIDHYQQVQFINKEKLNLTEYIYLSGLQKFKKEIQEDLEWVITREQIGGIAYKL